MDSQQIKAFIDAMSASDLDEMEVSHDGWTLRLVRNGRGAAPAAPAAPPAARTQAKPAAAPLRTRGAGPASVQAPMYGVVHLQQAPGEPAFVKAGDTIEAGQLLCTIEAMKVFNEVRAEQAGRVLAVLVPTGAEVEAGQALFTVEEPARV
ncbi:MAG: acetyl-CoA carboxylase biotin carboxyl carrier protein subunit [Rubrivivax sp.]